LIAVILAASWEAGDIGSPGTCIAFGKAVQKRQNLLRGDLVEVPKKSLSSEPKMQDKVI
jgi:hypothetical protein